MTSENPSGTLPFVILIETWQLPGCVNCAHIQAYIDLLPLTLPAGLVLISLTVNFVSICSDDPQEANCTILSCFLFVMFSGYPDGACVMCDVLIKRLPVSDQFQEKAF